MKLTLKPRRSPASTADQLEFGVDENGNVANLDGRVEPEPPPIGSGEQQAYSRLATRAATAGLLTCLVLGPIGAAAGGLALAQSGGTDHALPRTSGVVSDELVAGEFAQRVVVAWLTATRGKPGELANLVRSTESADLPEQAFAVSNPTVAKIVGDGNTWSVTVSATVTDARQRTARRFYQVPIRISGGSVAALTLPAPVTGPAIDPTQRAAYGNPLAANTAIGTTVAQFLSAYLAGSGDVSRYLTPGSAIIAIAPAPYTTVTLQSLSANADVDGNAAPTDRERIGVVASAAAVVTSKQASNVTYALTLTARAGRWEVTAIDLSPVTSSSSGQPAPSSSPS